MDVEYPSAKRVRRCELHSQSTSPTPSDSPSQNTALKDHFTQQLEALYSFPSPDINGETDVNPPLKAPSNQESKPDPEAFTFRLLAPDPRKNAALDPARTQKILLRSPTPPGQDPGLLPPQHRPLGHYLTAATPSTARQQGEYAAAAVEGHCVMEEARQRWPGASLPWRVTTLPATSLRVKQSDDPARRIQNASLRSSQEAIGKRRRHGKKRRIVIRMRRAAEEESVRTRKEEEMQRESRWEEKRKSENRKKKLRKREKDKAKKAGIVPDM